MLILMKRVKSHEMQYCYLSQAPLRQGGVDSEFDAIPLVQVVTPWSLLRVPSAQFSTCPPLPRSYHHTNLSFAAQFKFPERILFDELGSLEAEGFSLGHALVGIRWSAWTEDAAETRVFLGPIRWEGRTEESQMYRTEPFGVGRVVVGDSLKRR